MIAIDTNLLVRLLVNDNPAQVKRAKALFDGEAKVFIAKTVLLETIWVLRQAYDSDKFTIVNGIEKISAMPNIVFEDAPAVNQAMQWVVERNLDFADALHLATAHAFDAQLFYSFDRLLVKRAGKLLAIEPDE